MRVWLWWLQVLYRAKARHPEDLARNGGREAAAAAAIPTGIDMVPW